MSKWLSFTLTNIKLLISDGTVNIISCNKANRQQHYVIASGRLSLDMLEITESGRNACLRP